jgi:hypothetical protein
VNSNWFPAPPIANALLATSAFVASLFPVTVYVPELRNSALNTATLSASVALSFDGYSGSGLVPLMRAKL